MMMMMMPMKFRVIRKPISLAKSEVQPVPKPAPWIGMFSRILVQEGKGTCGSCRGAV
jgi:hypothetical protein